MGNIIITRKNENQKINQEEVWDNISDFWEGFKKEPFFKVKEFLEGKKGLVLDLGCGVGRNMVPNDNLEYYGVDFSKEQLKTAEQLTKNKGIKAKFFRLNADNLSIFKNETFDYGLFIATLHCLETGKQRENALMEFYRILKKGAEALISVWNSEDERFNHLNNHGDIYMSWENNGKINMRYYYLYSKEEFLDLIKKTGFKVLEISEKDSHNDRFSKKNLIVRVKK